MEKSDRQKAILDIIAASRVTRQDELADALRYRGFAVTQASISRDLDQLGVVKVNGTYTRPPRDFRSGSFGVDSVIPSGDSLLVVRCASGLASAAAVLIDAAGVRGIAGTIAGDDTIFVAVTDAATRPLVESALKELFGFENGGDK
jgi:transcriptional regulator of arginine metabolism